VQGTQGWEKRKQPDYTPNEKQRTYQQAYYQRKKAAHAAAPLPERVSPGSGSAEGTCTQQPATAPAEKD
jgi:hypothetical protein